MPYIKLYGKFECSAIHLIWDRFGDKTLKESDVVYRDKKIGHRRGVIDYLFYIYFVTRWLLLNSRVDDRILIFGPQLVFFLWPILLLKKSSFAVDYRDYHFLTKFTPRFIYNAARFVAVSSPGYVPLLPNTSNVLLSHNFIFEEKKYKYKKIDKPIYISCIGAIRDVEANSRLIASLGHNDDYMLSFDGTGLAVNELKNACAIMNARNVLFSGFYDKFDEWRLYKRSGLINLLRLPDSLNNRIALPNRLYNAPFYKVPILCYEGCLLADYVRNYNIGLVLSEDVDFDDAIQTYFSDFDSVIFERNADIFLADVRQEQSVFLSVVKGFFG